MYQKLIYLFVFSLFLLSAGTQVHSQTEVLWSKYFSHLGGVKFSKDGKVVAVASKDTVFLFDAYTGEPTMYEKIPYNMGLREINRIEISNDGRFILGSSGSNTKLWYFETGKLYKYIKDRDGTSSVALLPDSRHMVTADQTDNKNNVFIWDIEDSVKIKSGDLQGRALDIAVSGDGRYISFRQILGSSECVSLWSVDEFQQIERLGCIGDYKNINDMAFSPDGRYLASGDDSGYIKLWDLKNNMLFREKYHTDATGERLYVHRLIFTNNSKYLITCGGYFFDKTTKIWKIPEFELVQSYDHPMMVWSSIDISPNDSLLAGDFDGKLSVIGINYNLSSIKNSNTENDTTIIPNPVEDILSVIYDKEIQSDLRISISNIEGKLIKIVSHDQIFYNNNSIKINVSYLSPGSYFLNINSDGFSKTFSFIKI
jgi:WD40 repeat protein